MNLSTFLFCVHLLFLLLYLLGERSTWAILKFLKLSPLFDVFCQFYFSVKKDTPTDVFCQFFFSAKKHTPLTFFINCFYTQLPIFVNIFGPYLSLFEPRGASGELGVAPESYWEARGNSGGLGEAPGSYREAAGARESSGGARGSSGELLGSSGNSGGARGSSGEL